MHRIYFFLRLFVFLMVICSFIGCYSPLGDQVHKDFGSYFYSRDGEEILYCSSPISWDLVGVIKMEADVNTFEVISPGFAKDKNHLFYGSEVVNDSIVDKSSFFTRNNHPWMLGIGFDKNGVYVFSDQDVPKKVVQADPATYEVIRYGRTWAKDARFYYYEDRCVDVDYTSFKILNLYFSVDSTSAYFNINNQFYPIDADPTTFKELDFTPRTNNYSCTYDTENVYYYIRYGYQGKYTDTMIKTQYQDITTIKEVGDYLRIDDALYYGGEKLKGIDVDSLEIGGDYLKSKSFVVYKGKRVQEIDANSIRFIDSYDEYIRDSDYLFYQGKKVKQIDVNTMEFMGRDYVKDKKAVFYQGKVIPKADGATFEYYGKGILYKDKNYEYYEGKVYAVIDSVTGEIKYD